MKIQSRKQQESLFFLAAANLGLRWTERYRIQTDFIETKNFMPDTLAIHRFPQNYGAGLDCLTYLLSKGEMWMPALDLETNDCLNLLQTAPSAIPQFKLEDDEDDDEDWDEDDDDDDFDDDDEDSDEDDGDEE